MGTTQVLATGYPQTSLCCYQVFVGGMLAYDISYSILYRYFSHAALYSPLRFFMILQQKHSGETDFVALSCASFEPESFSIMPNALTYPII